MIKVSYLLTCFLPLLSNLWTCEQEIAAPSTRQQSVHVEFDDVVEERSSLANREDKFHKDPVSSPLPLAALREKQSLTFTDLPHELIYKIFTELADGALDSVKSIIRVGSVNRALYKISEDSALLKYLRRSIHGDYPEDQATKYNAVMHMLRVKVNLSKDPLEIAHLIMKYDLWKDDSFADYSELLDHYGKLGCAYKGFVPSYWLTIYDIRSYINEKYSKKLDSHEIKQRKKLFLKDLFHNASNDKAVVEYNEILIIEGNEAAIKRKLNGLAKGCYGYSKDKQAAKTYLLELIKNNHPRSKLWHYEAYVYGMYGFKKDRQQAFWLNEQLINSGDEQAMTVKLKCLFSNKYGYEMKNKSFYKFIDDMIAKGHSQFMRAGLRYVNDNTILFSLEKPIHYLCEKLIELNDPWIVDYKHEQALCGLKSYFYDSTYIDALVDQGNKVAIELKLKGLNYGNHGYERDSDAVTAFIDVQILQGNDDAVHYKLKGLCNGRYGYSKDVEHARIMNEQLIQSGNRQAMHRKIAALSNESNSIPIYSPNSDDAHVLNESLISVDDPIAINRKIHSLMIGGKACRQDLEECKNFITERKNAGCRWAQYLYIQGIKWGQFGFDCNKAAARDYIKLNHIPF